MEQSGPEASAGSGHPVATREQFVAFYQLAVRPAHRSASRLCGGNRVQSEDLVQEVFMDLVRQIRDGRITTVDIGWIIVAIRHRYIDQLRRRDREEQRLRLVWSRDQIAGRGGADSSNDRATQMLALLPEMQRVAVVLHHVDGLPIADVATALGRSVHATESVIARGREQLRRLLREDTDGD